MNNEQKLREDDILAKLDTAFEREIKLISTLEYNSNEICRVFYSNLRAALAATAAPDESARDAALEEAAKVCIDAANSTTGPRSIMAAGCAMEIRALKSSPSHAAREDADSKRLDWLVENVAIVNKEKQGNYSVVRNVTAYTGFGDTTAHTSARAAIDAAMATAASSALSAAAPSADAKGEGDGR